MPEIDIQTDLTDAQRRHTLRFVYVAATLGTITATCLSGNVMNLLAIRLGAEEITLGILSFAMVAPLTFTIFTMNAIERIGKRAVLLRWYGAHAVLALAVPLLPWMAQRVSTKLSLAAVILLTFLLRGAMGLGITGWFPIIQDNLSDEHTGRFFGNLRTCWQSVQLVLLIGLAWYCGREPTWTQFQVIFALGALASVCRTAALTQFAEHAPRGQDGPRQHLLGRLRAVWRNRRLRPFITYVLLYVSAATITEPFKIKYLKDLGYGDQFILAATAMVALGGVLSLRAWGRLADRFGNRSIFSISHVGMIAATASWLLVDDTTFGAVVALALFMFWAVFNSGNGIVQTRYLMHTVSGDSQNDITLINLMSFLAMATAPFLGGLFLRVTEDFGFVHGALTLNHYQLFFIIATVLFVAPHRLRRRLKTRHETPTAEVISFATQSLRASFGPFWGLRRAAGSETASRQNRQMERSTWPSSSSESDDGASGTGGDAGGGDGEAGSSAEGK